MATAVREAIRQDGLRYTLAPHEWRRRLMHMSPGLLPFFMLAIPHPIPLAWYSKLVIVIAVAGVACFALKREHLFVRANERTWSTSVISYAIVTLVMLLGFPSEPEMGMAVTMIIAFGDGSATLGGKLVHGRSLPWNSDKSWAGLFAFLLCSIPLAAFVYWGEARPQVSPSMALACVAPAALAAAFAESLPMRLNDNIRVGVTAGLMMLLTHKFFG
jgi:dolichol kinase